MIAKNDFDGFIWRFVFRTAVIILSMAVSSDILIRCFRIRFSSQVRKCAFDVRKFNECLKIT